MSATDNAFIKAYRDSARRIPVPARERQLRSGVADEVDAVTIQQAITAVSQVYAGQNVTRPIPIGSTDQVRIVDPPTSHRVPSPHIPLTAFKGSSVDDKTPNNLTDGDRNHQVNSVSAAIPDAATGVSATATAESLHSEAHHEAEWLTESPDASPTAGAAESLQGIARDESSPIADANWSPEWEVDQFRWPSTCNSLHDQAVVRLSEALRPMLHMAWQGKNVIGLTSASQGEGTTTVGLCMARMAASFNARVALIDGDLESPKIGQAVGMTDPQGWNQSTSAREAAVASIEDRVVIIPAAKALDSPQPHILNQMIEEVRQQFELVLIDTGPIFRSAHRWFVEGMSESFDSVLIVRDVRATPRGQVEDVGARLSKVGIDNVAIVDNFLENH